MKILLLAPFLASGNPRHGGEKLLFEMTVQLATRHEVAVLAFCRPGGEDPARVRCLREVCSVVRTVEKDLFHIPSARRLANLASLTPSWFLHTASREFKAGIRSLAAFRPDIVQVEFLGMTPYVEELEHPAVVFNSHEAVGRSWRRRAAGADGVLLGAYLWWDYWRLARAEKRCLSRFHGVLALSREDRDYFRGASREASVHLWTPGVRVPDRVGRGPSRGGGAEPRLLFLGAFLHPPNVEGIRFFCRDILPLIRKERPGVHLDIVGPEPPAAVRSLQGPAVTVHGYVADLSRFFARGPVFVVPILRAGGIRMKILEALGAGLPVVTTPQGAQGIDAVHGEQLFLAGDPETFAACVCRLLGDPGLRAGVGRQGRAWVARHHGWDRALDRLEAVYREILERPA